MHLANYTEEYIEGLLYFLNSWADDDACYVSDILDGATKHYEKYGSVSDKQIETLRKVYADLIEAHWHMEE